MTASPGRPHRAPHRSRRRRARRWPALALLLATTAAAAQEPTPRPIDPAAPDVVAFSERSAEQPGEALAEALALGLPGDQFFATFDPDLARRFEAAPDDPIELAAAATCAQELVASDGSERRAWFQVNYGPPCKMALYCNWLEDEADAGVALRTDERSLEPGGGPAAAEDTDGRTAAEASRFAQDDDVHTEGYPEIAITIVLAGTRPCDLRRYCDGRDDVLCSERFLRLKAEQISIQQLGR